MKNWSVELFWKYNDLEDRDIALVSRLLEFECDNDNNWWPDLVAVRIWEW